MNLSELKECNLKIIRSLKKEIAEKKDSVNLNDELLLHSKIENLLDMDEALFFHITVDEAFQILSCIMDGKETVMQAYKDLTSPQEYKKLVDDFKLG